MGVGLPAVVILSVWVLLGLVFCCGLVCVCVGLVFVCGCLGYCLLGYYCLLLDCFNSVVYAIVGPSLALDVWVYIVGGLVI